LTVHKSQASIQSFGRQHLEVQTSQSGVQSSTIRRIGVLFFLANVAFVILVGIVFIVPVLQSLGAVRAEVDLLERRYAAEVRLLLDYEENSQELASLRDCTFLSEDEMLPVLAEFSEIGEQFGLETLEFVASEIATSNFGGLDTEFLEKRVRVSYEGEFFYLQVALQEFCGVRARSFSLENERLFVNFSLFGRGQ